MVVVAAALGLRLAALARLPPGPFVDEAYTAYDALSLLRTGRDLWGEAWPLYFASWGGDAIEGTYRYLCVPFVAALGPTALAARLPAALAGTLTVWLTYLLGRRLLGAWPGVAAAALLAISPWHFQFSRIGFRGILVPAFAVAAAWCAAAASGIAAPGLPSPPARPRLWIAAAALLGCGLYTYSVAKVFFPLFGALLLAVFAAQARRRPAAAAALVVLAAALALPAARATFWGRGQVRFEAISTFRPAALEAGAERLRGRPGLAWLAGSRAAVGAWLVGDNYLSHFSPGFLLTRGDRNPRHAVSGVGQLQWVEAVLLGIGLVVALRRRSRVDAWLVGWLLIGPVGGSLTDDRVPNALRALAELPAPQLLAASGAAGAWGLARRLRPAARRAIALAAAAGLLAGSARHVTAYATRYAVESASAWNAGYPEGIVALDEAAPPGTRRIVARPEDWRVGRDALNPYFHSLILVYGKIEPRRFQAAGMGPWEVARIPEHGLLGGADVPAGAWMLLPADRARPGEVIRWIRGAGGEPLVAVLRGG
jgi:4-amino-4-deoxy-L-arabinose transferase-like glycosyltransferase